MKKVLALVVGGMMFVSWCTPNSWAQATWGAISGYVSDPTGAAVPDANVTVTEVKTGIVTKGGEAPNIVPAETSAKYYVRARTLRELEALEPRVMRCFDAGRIATGATYDVRHASPPYSEFRPDQELLAAYRHCAGQLGRTFVDFDKTPGFELKGGSTDMANVSLELPAIHPLLGIDSLPAVNHQPEFAAAAVSPAADRAVVDGALAMAWTAIEVAAEGPLRHRLLGAKPQSSR